MAECENLRDVCDRVGGDGLIESVLEWNQTRFKFDDVLFIRILKISMISFNLSKR